MIDYSYTDGDGDKFTAMSIGEGLIKLRGTYGAKEAEGVDIDFRAGDLDAMIDILRQAAKDADSESTSAP